jgi:hypothetical protein
LLSTKNLELLHELVPKGRVIGALANLSNPNAEHQVKDLQAAARILGVEIVGLAGSNEREIDSSFATMVERKIEALVVTADGFLISRQDQIVALAARYAVPTMYPLSQYVAAGGLMSYGANLRDAFRQTGVYVGRILKGAKPADLPVLQPTKVELVINAKAAKALGLTVPDRLIATPTRSSSEAPQVHHAARRCGGMADCGARAAAADTGDRIFAPRTTGPINNDECLPPGFEGSGLHRRPECKDRKSLGERGARCTANHCGRPG